MILYILFFKPIKAAIPQGGFQSIKGGGAVEDCVISFDTVVSPAIN